MIHCLTLPQGALIHIKPNEIGRDDGRLDVLSNWIQDNASLLTNTKILDIGSNCGHFLFLYSQLGANKVIGIEGRKEFVNTFNIIKSEYYKDNNIEIINSDLRDIDYNNIGHIHILSTIGIIYHVEGIEDILKIILDITKPEVWFVESQLWNDTHKFIEGGSGSDATQSIKQELVLRPNAKTVEDMIQRFGYTHIRMPLSDLYALDSIAKDPRGFWLCIRNDNK